MCRYETSPCLVTIDTGAYVAFAKSGIIVFCRWHLGRSFLSWMTGWWSSLKWSMVWFSIFLWKVTAEFILGLDVLWGNDASGFEAPCAVTRPRRDVSVVFQSAAVFRLLASDDVILVLYGIVVKSPLGVSWQIGVWESSLEDLWEDIWVSSELGKDRQWCYWQHLISNIKRWWQLCDKCTSSWCPHIGMFWLKELQSQKAIGLSSVFKCTLLTCATSTEVESWSYVFREQTEWKVSHML